MKYIFFLFIIVILTTSCSRKKDFGTEIETIHLKESKDILPIYTFIKNLDYVELDVSSTDVEIGEIQDLKIFGNDIILKHRKSGTINFLRFSKDGKFICDLTKNRKGNELVTDPQDIIQYRKDYAILGANAIHIISKNGIYKEKHFNEEMSGNVFFNSNNNFFLINKTMSSGFLTEVGVSNNKIQINVTDDSRQTNIGYTGVSPQGKEDLHLFSYLNDTVFVFSGNRLNPRYIIEGSPYPTYTNVLLNAGDRDELETQKYIHNTQYVVVKNYLENKNFVFITYWIGSNSCTVIINKKTGETRYFARGVNNIDGGIWDKAFYLSDNDELYIPISSYKIGGHKISDKKRKGFEKLQEKIQVSGNPVVMRCKLK